MQKILNIRFFLLGCVLCLLPMGYLFYITFLYGMKDAFLMLNGDAGYVADQFFRFFTYFGDAMLWLPMLAYIVWKKRKLYLGLAITSFSLVTAFVQICKYLIVPDEPRPTTYITDGSFIHTVAGVEVHSISSFPSGHTATAFAFFLIITLMTTKRWWLPVGFIMAVLVGYSRIYLAQHFPLDVAAGIVVAILSVGIAIPVQRWIDKRNSRVSPNIKA
jgi:membrane-associated phospholipid phosphatase